MMPVAPLTPLQAVAGDNRRLTAELAQSTLRAAELEQQQAPAIPRP